MSNRELFGAASEGGGGRTKNHNLVEGDNVFRIGPAYGSLRASGKWFVYTKTHYGYRSTPDEMFPKGALRTFLCPQEIDRRTEMVIKPCAECDDIESIAHLVETRKTKMEAEGKTEEQIDAVVGPHKEYLKAHNLSKRYIVLAKNEDNEWGVLWLPYKAKEALDNRRKKVREEDGIDILDMDEGAWVCFNRTGTGSKTVYSCDVVQETVTLENGKKAKQIKQEALTEADFDAIVATCPDLTTVGRKLTSEQIERLVESKGDPEVVDTVFNESYEASKVTKAEASPKPAPKAPTVKAPKAKVQPEPEVQDTPEVPDSEPQKNPEPVDEEAELLAKLEAARQKKKAAALVEKVGNKAPEEIKPESESSPIPENVDEMPDDEFLAVFSKKKK